MVPSAYLRLWTFLLAILIPWTSLVAQMVKCLPTTWETQVQSLGWEDPLKKAMATTPVFLPGKAHGRRSLIGYSTWGRKESDRTEQLRFLSLVNFKLDIDQISSVAQSCPTLCDPMNRSTPGLPVHDQLPEFTQIHIHRVSDAIQPSHPRSSPSPPAPILVNTQN